jgi:hypothetical protein
MSDRKLILISAVGFAIGLIIGLAFLANDYVFILR